ncbi:hypothetical protein D3C73_1511990 [compost metagenome]
MLGNDVIGGHVVGVDGGMGVGGEHHVIAQFQGLAHGGIDAIVGLQAADDHALDVPLLQDLQQAGLVKRIPGSFSYSQIFG